MIQENIILNRKKKIFLIVLAIIVAIVLLGVILKPFYCSFARERWKRDAIKQISELVADKKMLDAKIADIEKARGKNSDSLSWWFNDRIILLKSGEWLVYASCDSHESPVLKDHFIAKASDGKWYYTSVHFCKGMLSLMQDFDGQPKDLPLFIKVYRLTVFDGRSSDCLKETSFLPDLSPLEAQTQ